MSDQPSQGSQPDTVREGLAASPLENTFLTQKRYPGEIEAPSLPLPPSKPPSSHVFTRIVLPLLIFVVAIGVIAWVTQYIPSRGTQTGEGEGPQRPPEKPAQVLLQPDGPGWLSMDPGSATKSLIFTAGWDVPVDKVVALGACTVGVLCLPLGQGPLATATTLFRGREKLDPVKDENRKKILPEYEVVTNDLFDPGYYDFIFRNGSDETVEVGLIEQGCRCSRIEACALADSAWDAYLTAQKGKDPVKHTPEKGVNDGLAWKQLVKDAQTGLLVPAGNHLVVRLHWDGRKEQPEQVPLTARIWASPAGKPSARQQVAQLNATVAYVPPVRFYPEKVDIGTLSANRTSEAASFVCWSATREFQVTVDDKDKDPCYEFNPTALTDEECRELEKQLSAKDIATRIRSAYRVHVRVHETKGGKQLDLGAFLKTAPLVLRSKGELLTKLHLPTVRGMVLGDIRLGALEDQEKINLKTFKASIGTLAKFKLWAKPGLKLEYVDVEPGHLDLKVEKLRETDQRELAWTVWEVQLRVGPNIPPGPLPENAVLRLRVANQTPPRVMRIPIVGTASRN